MVSGVLDPSYSSSSSQSAMSGSSDEELLYLDPKSLRGPSQSASSMRTSFQDAIVFMVGGGSVIEYQNLQEYAQVSCELIYK
jgi:hypothetical protein